MAYGHYKLEIHFSITVVKSGLFEEGHLDKLYWMVCLNHKFQLPHYHCYEFHILRMEIEEGHGMRAFWVLSSLSLFSFRYDTNIAFISIRHATGQGIPSFQQQQQQEEAPHQLWKIPFYWLAGNEHWARATIRTTVFILSVGLAQEAIKWWMGLGTTLR